MPDSPYMLGIDIGGTHIRMGAVDEGGAVLRHQIESSRTYLCRAKPADALVRAIASFAADTPGALRGVCIGFPGTVSKDKSTVLSCPNLPAFDGVNIRDALQPALNVPVTVEHEVLLLMTNDLRAYQLQQEACVMAVYLGTGIGNAMYIHGRLLEGKNGTSGELGHIPVPDSQIQCPCGNIGCIEPSASGKRLEAIREVLYPQSPDFEAMFAVAGNSSEISRYLDHVACAIATEINILDPDCILLGGGVLSIANFPYDALLTLIRLHTRKPYPAETLRFIRLAVDPLQGMRGAGLYAWQRA